MKGLRFLSKYARNYLGYLIITVISMFMLVGVQLLAPWLIREMIQR